MFRILATVFALCLALANGSVLDTAQQNGCGKVVGLIQTAGLTSALDAANDVTLFAPSDAAIDAIPPAVLNLLTGNMTLLQNVLKYHVVVGVKMATSLVNDEVLPTLAGSSKLRTNIYKNGQVVTAQGSTVSVADLSASNGVVHVIDKVIYPIPDQDIPTYMILNKDLGDVAYMVYRGQLTNTLSAQSFTVFAPNNAAIAKLTAQQYNDLLTNLTEIQDVLTYHAVAGTVYSSGLSDGMKVKTVQGGEVEIKIDSAGVTVNGERVVTADVSTTNGVIHVIDSVLLPPSASRPAGVIIG